MCLNGFEPECDSDYSDPIYGPPHKIYERRPVPPFGHVEEVLSRAYPTDEQRHVIYMRHLEDHYTQYPTLYRDAAYANKSRPIEYRLRVLKLHLHDKKERDLPALAVRSPQSGSVTCSVTCALVITAT